jgi:hypothetical protein
MACVAAGIAMDSLFGSFVAMTKELASAAKSRLSKLVALWQV